MKTVRLAVLVVVAALAAGALPAAAVDAPQASAGVQPAVALAAPGDTVTLVGHGYGHGRGMGQYGALGYAVDHGWSYDQILTYFYGGTRLASDAGNPTMTVELTAFTGKDAIVTAPGLVVNGRALSRGAVLVHRQADGSLQVLAGDSCGGPWTVWSQGTTTVTIATSASASSLTNLLRTCDASTTRGYRGTLTAVSTNGTQYLVNNLPTETYLRGVVPRESPASWSSAGGGRGLQALKAQAVAARSYALASGARPSGALTCDTTACQVYGGAYLWPYGQGSPTALEAAGTDTAISQTASQVMRMSNGTVARTEFSSSTGGYTAGGTFPAVVDAGDQTASNRNHTWTVSLPVSQVAAGLGVGSIRTMAVTARNGLGADGGRVTTLTVVDGTGATRTFTGDQVRTALGLKSNWFTIAWVSPTQARAVVTSLYEDLLGRGPDPTGLSGWSTALLSGTSQAALVSSLTASDEYISLRVAQAFTQVLGRGVDPTGAADWARAVRTGHFGVDDVARRLMDSDEFYTSTGGTDSGYVKRLYQAVLGREASTAEITSWADMTKTYGRTWLVNSIWWSQEAAAARAGAYYQVFLRRAPDTVGLTAWAQVLLGYGEGTVRAGIAGSAEYAALALTRHPDA